MSVRSVPAAPTLRGALRILAAASLTAGLSGCALLESHGEPEYSLLGGSSDRVNSAGVHQMLGPEFERLDLVRLLAVGQDESAAQAQAMQTCQAQVTRGDDYLQGCLIDLAFSRYHADAARDTPAHRNAIQDSILSASDQRCNISLTYIQRHQSATDFFLGSLTTLLAGGGAIERAVGDALRYHGACTVMAGLEETDTQLSATAGVKAMARALQTVAQVQQQAQTVGAAASAAPK